MRLYTFISKDEFHTLNTKGYLICDENRVDRYLRKAYSFMADNLEQKYSKKNINLEENIVYPRWAWYSWENNKDILSCEDLMENYKPGTYLMVCNIPDEQVLLSDYDNWHFPLNYMYLARTDEEDDEIEELHSNHKISQEEYNDRMRKSWLNVFDLKFPNRYLSDENEHSLQAVFWVLFLNQVEELDLV